MAGYGRRTPRHRRHRPLLCLKAEASCIFTCCNLTGSPALPQMMITLGCTAHCTPAAEPGCSLGRAVNQGGCHIQAGKHCWQAGISSLLWQ